MRFVVLAMLAGCSGVPADLALDEPLRVPSAQFVDGVLPGGDAGPAITFVESQGANVRLGQAVKRLQGRASTDAVAVGVAFAGVGQGYWVAPIGPPDPTADYELTWTLDASLGYDLPLGPGAIDLVAIDDAGRAGPQEHVAVCVRPDLIDATACTTLAPPDTVLSLAWDGPADLDLQVRTPDGTLVSASHPSTVGHDPPISSAELAVAGTLDHDANAACRSDGAPRESLVWKSAPVAGDYFVYANLADACGAAAVTFRATLYRSDVVDGVPRLVENARADGRLISVAANGGRGTGLFLLQLAL